MNLNAQAPVKPDESRIYKKTGETELRLHFFYPASHRKTGRTPAIVFFFGGGWNRGTPEQFYPFCSYLASRGMVAVSAEYRVNSRNQTSPAECVKDGKSAVRWLRTHAEELGIDPDKLAAGGGSAGGQVAAATATSKGFLEEGEDIRISCVPNALVLMNPVFDNGPGPGAYSHERVKDYWQDFSPMHNLDKDTPPTAVFLGTEDPLIPVKTAETYKARMEANGTRCDLHLFEGRGHGFFNFQHAENYLRVVEKMDSFLVSLDYLKPEATE